jgi:hypothetical protein
VRIVCVRAFNITMHANIVRISPGAFTLNVTFVTWTVIFVTNFDITVTYRSSGSKSNPSSSSILSKIRSLVSFALWRSRPAIVNTEKCSYRCSAAIYMGVCELVRISRREHFRWFCRRPDFLARNTERVKIMFWPRTLISRCIHHNLALNLFPKSKSQMSRLNQRPRKDCINSMKMSLWLEYSTIQLRVLGYFINNTNPTWSGFDQHCHCQRDLVSDNSRAFSTVKSVLWPSQASQKQICQLGVQHIVTKQSSASSAYDEMQFKRN